MRVFIGLDVSLAKNDDLRHRPQRRRTVQATGGVVRELWIKNGKRRARCRCPPLSSRGSQARLRVRDGFAHYDVVFDRIRGIVQVLLVGET